ncbi:hypothetical protein MLP_50050 [Microlunatus phosphovorus NM-1]|uniref:Uncharacterized protein n=1 Tax=Microlunatus phosphovorus (strain ATCC 700054 / DSM 10555 / JCM 9379 / NBRC 101784 / NCIMB 13414 / VKM Ac-1990 / NM-1) TaxID=1032480 RepID=F5XG85_MICPN|nr:hypothetical protein MLP_50050 [Microlunatus phosphovorus NM-1]
MIVGARGLPERRGVHSRRLLRCAHVLQVGARSCADSVRFPWLGYVSWWSLRARSGWAEMSLNPPLIGGQCVRR